MNYTANMAHVADIVEKELQRMLKLKDAKDAPTKEIFKCLDDMGTLRMSWILGQENKPGEIVFYIDKLFTTNGVTVQSNFWGFKTEQWWPTEFYRRLEELWSRVQFFTDRGFVDTYKTAFHLAYKVPDHPNSIKVMRRYPVLYLAPIICNLMQSYIHQDR